VTSTIVNVLLAISLSVHSADEEQRQPGGPGAEPRRLRRLGKTLIEGVGNYLIAAHPQVGNFVIVSTGAIAEWNAGWEAEP